MKKVLLTGVSGYIGQHCAVELIKQGYKVKGSLRSLKKIEEVLKGISKEINPEGKIEFCELNLTSDKGWEEAMQDCDYVLHVASPFVTKEPKDENELIRPAVDGSLRALKAAKKAGIKRVVLTSSIVSMLEDAKGGKQLTQNSWTDTNADVSAYIKSKTLAEKAAWEFIKNQPEENKLELVVINPGAVYGPTLTGNLSGESMNLFNQMMSGKMSAIPKGGVNISDVRDIAKLHVMALENEKANGNRYLVSSEKPHSFFEMASILKNNGYNKVSTKLAPTFLLRLLANFSPDLKGMKPFIGKTYIGDISETLKTFDWKPVPLEQTVLDTAKSIEAVI